MTYTVKQVNDSKYIILELTGEVTMKDHESGRADANLALSATGWSRLLVDATRIDANMSVTDDYKFTSEHPLNHPQVVRIAVLHRHEEYDRFRFIENIARNRGVNLKLFNDRVVALKWLVGN